MDERLDTGDLLYQVRMRTRMNDTVASLYDRVIAKGLSLLPRLIADARRGRLPRRAQPAEGGSYCSAAKQSDFRINWSLPAETVRRWITITPGKCFTTLREERIYLLDARVAGREKGTGPGFPTGPEAGAERGTAAGTEKTHLSIFSPPGTLLTIAPPGCTIATGQGALRLGRIQIASGQELPLSDFCRQIGATTGDCLGEEEHLRLLPEPALRVLGGKGVCRPFAPRGDRVMPLLPFSQLMADAEAGGYAVGYFESWNLESLLAVADAARAARSPVILGFSGIYLTHPGRAYADGLSVYAAMGLEVCRRLSVPACLLFNESPQFDSVLEAVELGFNLVMFSDEQLAPEETVSRVKQVCAKAHPAGAAVEAEMAVLPGMGRQVTEQPADFKLTERRRGPTFRRGDGRQRAGGEHRAGSSARP